MAFLRGHIISFAAYNKKIRLNMQSDLSDQIKQLDMQYATPSPDLYQRRLKLQSMFNLASTSEAEYQLLRACHLVYEQGDKVGKLLAHQIRQSYASRQILRMGNLVSDHKDINNRFVQFYSNLYSSECNPSIESIKAFFQNLDFPALSEVDRMDLESPLQNDEIEAAICGLQSGKSPGPDGLAVEFYKKFPKELTLTKRQVP